MFLPSLVTSLRFPKWLYNPPVLTNLPFLSSLSIGNLYPEVSSCDTSFQSSVSYFTSPQHMFVGRTCQSTVEIQGNVCYLRINLEEFDLPEGRKGKCGEDSFSISFDQPSNFSSIKPLCGQRSGLEVLLPVTRGSVVFLKFLLGSDLASWKMKISQEKCGKSRRRQSDFVEKLNNCNHMKNRRGKEKGAVRRMKKQLFGDGQKKRRKNRRFKRSLFSWMFSKSEGNTKKEGEENKTVATDQLRANTPLEIASKRVKNVPSDFYKVVAASNMELSQFSGHQTSKTVTSSDTSPNKVTKHSDTPKRNFKRRKSLFPSTPSWSGVLKTSTDLVCGPAYLVTPSHALTGGGAGCVLDSMTGTTNLTVIFSVYKVAVTSVTLHSDKMALVTLHSPVPSTVPPLCSAGLGDSVRQWVEQAVSDEEGG